MKRRKVFSAAALAAVGTAAVIVSASVAGDRSAAEIDDEEIPAEMLTNDFPAGSNGIIMDETGQTYFTTPCGDRMNAAGEIVMRAEEVFAAEMRRRCGYLENSSYEQCAALFREHDAAFREQLPAPCGNGAPSVRKE